MTRHPLIVLSAAPVVLLFALWTTASTTTAPRPGSIAITPKMNATQCLDAYARADRTPRLEANAAPAVAMFCTMATLLAVMVHQLSRTPKLGTAAHHLRRAGQLIGQKIELAVSDALDGVAAVSIASVPYAAATLTLSAGVVLLAVAVTATCFFPATAFVCAVVIGAAVLGRWTIDNRDAIAARMLAINLLFSDHLLFPAAESSCRLGRMLVADLVFLFADARPAKPAALIALPVFPPCIVVGPERRAEVAAAFTLLARSLRCRLHDSLIGGRVRLIAPHACSAPTEVATVAA